VLAMPTFELASVIIANFSISGAHHRKVHKSAAVAYDNTATSRCHSAAAKIPQQSEETLPVVDY